MMKKPGLSPFPIVMLVAFALTALLAFAPTRALANASLHELASVLRGERVPPEHAARAAEYSGGRLPRRDVTWGSTYRSSGPGSLEDRARRTIQEQSVDWLPFLEKRVHPNGICLTGQWKIDAASPYTGQYRQGTQALFVGRASAAMGETTQGHARGFGFAGKILPTLDPDASVATANFFAVDVLLGTNRRAYLGARMSSEPKLMSGLTGIGGAPLGLAIAEVLKKADATPTMRQLYPIAETGLAPGVTARAPKWMTIVADASNPADEREDFRIEISSTIRRRGMLTFSIWASDTTSDPESIGTADSQWQRLGAIELTESYVSFGCDSQLTFPHPRLRPEPEAAAR